MSPHDGIRASWHGKVWLVGAGPGDPELLTVRAARVLASAKVVAYDELVPAAVLDLAPRSAERIPVGRRACGVRHHDGRIHPLVVERALAGIDVVRLKCGDPFIFGRGGEEAEEFAAARIPFEVVPGVSAALGAAAAANVPLTHRECSSSVTFVTAHLATDGTSPASPGRGQHQEEGGAAFVASLPLHGTYVLYMGLGTIDRTLAAIAKVRGADLPACAVARATWSDQQIVRGTLATLGDRVREAKLPAPAIVIVGDVVGRAVESPADSARIIPLAIGS